MKNLTKNNVLNLVTNEKVDFLFQDQSWDENAWKLMSLLEFVL